MYKAPIEKMVCDSDRGDGGVYFYEEYLEWLNRDTGRGFRIQYKNHKLIFSEYFEIKFRLID